MFDLLPLRLDLATHSLCFIFHDDQDFSLSNLRLCSLNIHELLFLLWCVAKAASLIHHEDKFLESSFDNVMIVGRPWYFALGINLEVVICWNRKAYHRHIFIGFEGLIEIDHGDFPVFFVLLRDHLIVRCCYCVIQALGVVVVALEDIEGGTLLSSHVVLPSTTMCSMNTVVDLGLTLNLFLAYATRRDLTGTLHNSKLITTRQSDRLKYCEAIFSQ